MDQLWAAAELTTLCSRSPPHSHPFVAQGTVAFASGLQSWGFTLRKFAHMYAKKFGVEEDKLMERLWGDNFFDAKTKTWKKNSNGSGECVFFFESFSPRREKNKKRKEKMCDLTPFFSSCTQMASSSSALLCST